MKRSTQSLAVLGLSALSLAALAPATLAVPVTPINLNYQGTYHFDFNAAALGITPGSTGTLDFTFTPDPGNTTYSQVTVKNLTAKVSNGWSVSSSNLSSATTNGSVSENINFNDIFKGPDDPFQSTVDFRNYDPATGLFQPAGLTLPVDSIGSEAGFDLAYLDSSQLDPSTFAVSLNGKSIYSLQLAPNGQSFGTNIGPGSTVTGLNGTPDPQVGGTGGGTPAVPEPSSFALMGLGALPLLGVVRARRRAARA